MTARPPIAQFGDAIEDRRAIAIRDEAVRALEIIRADTDENVPNSARNDGSDSCLDGVHALASQTLDFIGKLEATALPLAYPAAPQGEEGKVDIARLREALQLCHDVLKDVLNEWMVTLPMRDRGVMSGAMLIARSALAPAAIASGRGEGA